MRFGCAHLERGSFYEKLGNGLCCLYANRVASEVDLFNRGWHIFEIGLDVCSCVELEALAVQREYFGHDGRINVVQDEWRDRERGTAMVRVAAAGWRCCAATIEKSLCSVRAHVFLHVWQQ